jgi:FG-GAP-like repeat
MKRIILAVISSFILFTSVSYAGTGNPVPVKKVFSIDDIKALADKYVNNNLNLKNPIIVDVDGDGIFDILVFKDGNVEYYKNTGTLEEPFFVLENKHYDKYTTAFFIKESIPYPIFFADKNGDGKLDMFAVTDKTYNVQENKTDYKVTYAENFMDMDTGTLITIILVLLIVVLIIAIVH